MSEIVFEQPRIIGIEPKPRNLRGTDTFSRQAVLKLSDIAQDKALVIEYPNFELLKIGRKRILTMGMRMYGTGRIITRSLDNRLYVWIRNCDLELTRQIKTNLQAHYGAGIE